MHGWTTRLLTRRSRELIKAEVKRSKRVADTYECADSKPQRWRSLSVQMSKRRRDASDNIEAIETEVVISSKRVGDQPEPAKPAAALTMRAYRCASPKNACLHARGILRFRRSLAAVAPFQ